MRRRRFLVANYCSLGITNPPITQFWKSLLLSLLKFEHLVLIIRKLVFTPLAALHKRCKKKKIKKSQPVIGNISMVSFLAFMSICYSVQDFFFFLNFVCLLESFMSELKRVMLETKSSTWVFSPVVLCWWFQFVGYWGFGSIWCLCRFLRFGSSLWVTWPYMSCMIMC